MILEELETLEGQDPEHGWQTQNRLSRLRSHMPGEDEPSSKGASNGSRGDPSKAPPAVPLSGPPSRPTTPATNLGKPQSRPTTPGGLGVARTLLQRLSGPISREASFDGQAQPADPQGTLGEPPRPRPGRIRRVWERLRQREETLEEEVRQKEEERVREAAATVDPGAVARLRRQLEQGSGSVGDGGAQGGTGQYVQDTAVRHEVLTITEELSIEMRELEISSQRSLDTAPRP